MAIGTKISSKKKKPIKMEHTKNQGPKDQKNNSGMSNTKGKQSDDRKTGTSRRTSDGSGGVDRSSKNDDARQ